MLQQSRCPCLFLSLIVFQAFANDGRPLIYEAEPLGPADPFPQHSSVLELLLQLILSDLTCAVVRLPGIQPAVAA